MVELGGARSYVTVSLRKDGRLMGTIAAYRQEVRPFCQAISQSPGMARPSRAR